MEFGEELVEIWNSLVPKVLDLASDNDTTGLPRFLDAYSYQEVSQGKYLVT